VVAGLNGGGGDVGAGGGHTVGTALAPGLPGVRGAPAGEAGGSWEGSGRGSGAGALSGDQPHYPAAGAEEDRGGPTVAVRMPGDSGRGSRGAWRPRP
jgi:hypothetical protein